MSEQPVERNDHEEKQYEHNNNQKDDHYPQPDSSWRARRFIWPPSQSPLAYLSLSMLPSPASLLHRYQAEEGRHEQQHQQIAQDWLNHGYDPIVYN